MNEQSTIRPVFGMVRVIRLILVAGLLLAAVALTPLETAQAAGIVVNSAADVAAVGYGAGDPVSDYVIFRPWVINSIGVCPP